MLKSKGNVPLDIHRIQEQAIPVQQADSLSYFDPSAKLILNSLFASLVQDVSEWMLSEARQDNISVLKLTVYGHVSPDDGTKQLIVTQFVDLPAAEALTYRRRLFKAFGVWTQTLSLSRRAAVLQNLVINVRWNANAPAHQP